MAISWRKPNSLTSIGDARNPISTDAVKANSYCIVIVAKWVDWVANICLKVVPLCASYAIRLEIVLDAARLLADCYALAVDD